MPGPINAHSGITHNIPRTPGQVKNTGGKFKQWQGTQVQAKKNTLSGPTSVLKSLKNYKIQVQAEVKLQLSKLTGTFSQNDRQIKAMGFGDGESYQIQKSLAHQVSGPQKNMQDSIAILREAQTEFSHSLANLGFSEQHAQAVFRQVVLQQQDDISSALNTLSASCRQHKDIGIKAEGMLKSIGINNPEYTKVFLARTHGKPQLMTNELASLGKSMIGKLQTHPAYGHVSNKAFAKFQNYNLPYETAVKIFNKAVETSGGNIQTLNSKLEQEYQQLGDKLKAGIFTYLTNTGISAVDAKQLAESFYKTGHENTAEAWNLARLHVEGSPKNTTGRGKAEAAATLGIPVNADATAIKQAYRKLALKHHPDKNQDRVEEATRLFRQIEKAYKTLISRT